MPSMQRLADHFGKQPFTILGVNMAEEKQDVEAFLQNRVSVSFPIIMDKDGSALKNWKVFAFPTSYVLDKQGKIRYALFGGIEWDTPDTINKIQKLLDE
jgi:thiol-disulfide isomerase/thioredoxin